MASAAAEKFRTLVKKRVHCSVGAVSEITKKYQQTGIVVGKLIQGRKRLTTQCEDGIMTRISLAQMLIEVFNSF